MTINRGVLLGGGVSGDVPPGKLSGRPGNMKDPLWENKEKLSSCSGKVNLYIQ